MSSPPPSPLQTSTSDIRGDKLSPDLLQYISSYRIAQPDIETFLIKVFGEADFGVHLSRENWIFWVPRLLSDDEVRTLQSQQDLRRSSEPTTPFTHPEIKPQIGSQNAHPAVANSSTKENDDLQTMSGEKESRKAHISTCRLCELLLIFQFLVLFMGLARVLWCLFVGWDWDKGLGGAGSTLILLNMGLSVVMDVHDRWSGWTRA